MNMLTEACSAKSHVRSEPLKIVTIADLIGDIFMQPEIRSSFVYAGQTILADWYTVTDKEAIPDLPWEQVYAIADLDSQVVLVSSAVSEKNFNLPGGHTESGETIEQTIARELVEECNMRLLDWQPLGYQHPTKPDGTSVYQFRVYARCEKIGEFTHDPGGGVKNTLVQLDEVNPHINYGEIGERMIELARPHFANDTKGK